MKLGIYGAGGLGREVLVLAQQLNQSSRWETIFFIDDVTDEKVVSGVPVHRFALLDLASTEVVIAIGEPAARERLAEKVLAKTNLATLIHPSVFIPHTTQVGAGAIICDHAFVSCDVSIGENTLLQPHSSVGHDNHIGMHSVLCGNATLGGNCQLGQRVFVGMNSSIKEKTTIGNDVILGMGCVVLSDIAAENVVVGNPARVLCKNDQKKIFK